MATTFKPLYATEATLTITADSLANSSGSTGRQSTAVSNTTNLYQDDILNVKIVTGASGVSATGYVNVWGYSVVEGGGYTDGLSGTDGATSLTFSTSNLVLLARLNAVANATTYNKGGISVANAFGGTLPSAWGVVLENVTGAALGTGNAVSYIGVNVQGV